MTPPHIVCLGGSHRYTFNGGARPTEICIGVASTVTISVTIPTGQHWSAPTVANRGLLTPSDAGVSGDSAHITVHAIAPGGTTVRITSAGSIVWELKIAIARGI